MKNKINNAEELKNAISELEKKKDLEEAAIKYQFQETYESYRPANILKNTIAEVSESPKFRHNLLNVVIGLGAGYLSQKLVVGRSAGIVKRVLGTALQYGVTTFIAKKGNAENGTPPKGKSLFKRIFSRPR
jgi:hypothetical protein